MISKANQINFMLRRGIELLHRGVRTQTFHTYKAISVYSINY